MLKQRGFIVMLAMAAVVAAGGTYHGFESGKFDELVYAKTQREVANNESTEEFIESTDSDKTVNTVSNPDVSSESMDEHTETDTGSKESSSNHDSEVTDRDIDNQDDNASEGLNIPQNSVLYDNEMPESDTRQWTMNTVSDVRNAMVAQATAQGTDVEHLSQYEIQWGDTLNRIAEAHNGTVSEYVFLNNIKNPDLIYAGDLLKLQ